MKYVFCVFCACFVLAKCASKKLSSEKTEQIQQFIRMVKDQALKNKPIEKEEAAQKVKAITVNKSPGPLSSPPTLQIRAGTEGEVGAIVRKLSAHFDVTIDNSNNVRMPFRNMELALRKKNEKSSDEVIEAQRPPWTKRYALLKNPN